jgi:hypothetical protein
MRCLSPSPIVQAQVLSDTAARKKLGKVSHKRDLDVPVMFFGTLEIAWIGKADILDFASGIKKGFLAKGKQKNFHKALEQVRGEVLGKWQLQLGLSRPFRVRERRNLGQNGHGCRMHGCGGMEGSPLTPPHAVACDDR